MYDLLIASHQPVYFIQEPGVKFHKEDFPVLSSWMERMLTDEAVREYILDTETHSRFMATVAAGSPNYNMLSQS